MADVKLKPNFDETPDVNIDAPIRMKKTIGLVNSITIIIGSMVGSGIFVSPTGIVENVHSFGASIVIWIACGLFSMLGAYCYAELGTLIHRSGGDYAYHLDAFGPFMGFMRLWIEVMVARPATMAVIGMTFAKYILQPVFPDCEQPETVLRCLSAVCLLILAFINAYSVRLSTRVQDLFTYAKMFALLLIIVTGFVRIGMACSLRFMSHIRFQAPLAFAIIYVAVTLFLVIFTFVGAPKESLMGVLIMLTAIPFYIFGCVWKKKPKSFERALLRLTIGTQKLIRLVPGS
ncbi:unnamed protein product [Dicrocoelium dendriticum]|nr:unnamed protein product [Dicrocoelium dendriticum]